MKRKISNKARVNISNAQHNRLMQKNSFIFNHDSDDKKAQRSFINSRYHSEILRRQKELGRTLSVVEKRTLYSTIETRCRRSDLFKSFKW